MGVLKVKSSVSGKLKTKSGISENLKSALYASMPGGLTFFKDYEKCDSIDADFSLGSGTGIFTSARDASNPATYIDEKGVIQKVTTADVPRFTKGYYDETGFHRKNGLLIESAGTNLLTYTDGTAHSGGLWTNWVESKNVSGATVVSNNVNNKINIVGSTTQRLMYTSISDSNKYAGLQSPITGAGSVSNGDKITISCLVRCVTECSGVQIKLYGQTLTDASIFISNYVSSDISMNLTNEFKLFTHTFTIADATASRFRFYMFVLGIDTGDIVDIEICRPQVEKKSYATSFIPTTTAVLSRPLETLQYALLGNRTASEENIFMKFAPISVFANDSIYRVLLDTETKQRVVRKLNNLAIIEAYANLSDDAFVHSSSVIVPQKYQSYVYGINFQHSSPYCQIFIDSVSDGTYIAGDYTTPAWSGNFFVGSDITNVSQANSIIQKLAFFNQIKNQTEITKITELLGN